MEKKTNYLAISVGIDFDPSDVEKFKELMQVHVDNTRKELGCMYF
ncbi:MAG: hypothetical protein ACKVK8_09890 [Rhodospirillales bacterium]|jgi:quinol monooxygenase YgiN